jgi:hypothetical protein
MQRPISAFDPSGRSGWDDSVERGGDHPHREATRWPRVVTDIYQQADEETTLKVVLGLLPHHTER